MQMPLMFEMKDRHVLVVGGGLVGFRKAYKLLEFGAKVTCLSDGFHDDFEQVSDIKRINGTYEPFYLEGMTLVIAATDKVSVNQRIYRDCHDKNILVMTVDKDNASDYHFMATARRENLLIGVSTQGGSPVFAKDLVEELMAGITEDQLSMLAEMIEQRRQRINELT